MALTTTTEEVAGQVPITVLALDGELDASNFERLIVEVQRALRPRHAQPARRPERAHVPRQLGARRAPLDRADPPWRASGRPRVGLGRAAPPGPRRGDRRRDAARGPARGPAACGRPRPAANGDGSPVRHPRGPRRRHRGVLRPVR